MNNYNKDIVYNIVKEFGKEILNSETFQKEKQFYQHGIYTVYQHSIDVACLSVYFALNSKSAIDYNSLVKGALLHDYFLYDWHKKDKDNPHRLHGFRHAKRALKNARRDFKLTEIEVDIIIKHMFPLNLFSIPKYKESWIVCLADKICALDETFSINKYKVELSKLPA